MGGGAQVPTRHVPISRAAALLWAVSRMLSHYPLRVIVRLGMGLLIGVTVWMGRTPSRFFYAFFRFFLDDNGSSSTR